MSITVTASDFTAEQIAEMRNWVAECDWIEDQDEIDEMTDAQIIRGVEKHYDGGIAAFDFGAIDELAREAAMVADFDSMFADAHYSDALDHSIAHLV